MENEIKRVYSGSVVNAEYIGSGMANNGIQFFLIRNSQETQKERLAAGWTTGTIKGDTSVYVFNKDYDKAFWALTVHFW